MLRIYLYYDNTKRDINPTPITFSIDSLGKARNRVTEEIVSHIVADGDDLRSILGAFDNLPYPRSVLYDRNVGVTWRGDLANFILDNW